MKAMRLVRRLAATAPFVLGFLFTLFVVAGNRAEALQAASSGLVESIDPPLPRAAGQPCVVELFKHQGWPEPLIEIIYNGQFTYTPPAACPPPWSKIILKLNVQNYRRSVLDTFGLDLANVRLFRSATPRYAGVDDGPPYYWNIERDLTDYSALFTAPQTGSFWTSQDPDATDYGEVTDYAFYGTGELLFYPPTAATPPPKVPDVVIAANQGQISLPHNVVRAYLDVENDFPGNPYWYTCASNDSSNFPLGDIAAPGDAPQLNIFPPQQGCGGGSFTEIQVAVDGALAGIAPAFPLIVADLSALAGNSVDQPIPTPEMLNFKPYRVDLTPFAAILSAAGTHNITANNDDAAGGGATLLLYLDPHKTQVTGAVTLNTLATENGAATDTDTLTMNGLTTQGDIKTREHRNFEIRGFVDTSQGRVDSRVDQTDDFLNTQAFYLVGPQFPPFPGPGVSGGPFNKVYHTHIWLTDSVQQTSTRAIGPRVINRDQTNTQYPLDFDYYIGSVMTNYGDGFYIGLSRTQFTVTQARVVDGDHYQFDTGRRYGPDYFTTHAASGFYGLRQGGSSIPHPLWQSSTTRDYSDNVGSCYHADMKADDGVITERTKGEGCPGGHDWVIWFAHPDGSPDNLDWQH